eukprot:scaffold10527_cov56-Cylindrotheca_fusiformis.AAC.1
MLESKPTRTAFVCIQYQVERRKQQILDGQKFDDDPFRYLTSLIAFDHKFGWQKWGVGSTIKESLGLSKRGVRGTIGWGIGLSGKRWGGVIKYRGGGTQLRSTVWGSCSNEKWASEGCPQLQRGEPPRNIVET